MLCAEHQGQNGKDTAACSYVQNLRLGCNELSKLSDTKLGGLMHSCSEGSARINMQYQLILVRGLYILPGRDHQDIINVELMEVLLPVVDPIDILCLIYSHAAFSDIHKLLQIFQLLFYGSQYAFHICALSVYLQAAILLLFYKEA